MAVETFRGKYVMGEDARKYIDIDAINDGCKSMDLAAEKLEDLQKKIDRLRELCSKEALSIQGESLDDRIELYERNINSFSLYIDDLSNAIQATTTRVFNRKQIILNEEAKRLDEKAVLENENVVQ